ncbi:IS4 family transposase [Geobacillus sp. C56-T2]|uniref:IS4 family transposase n=1 Tax=Geobacillus sp. C56-T2 TaxID=600773 RepID=UPI00119D7E63|nr:IS4 family transposase [Geobacillus sp. C56-T2]NNV07756.1 IS4 family transposase [Geobacillus sp. MMMUD3]TWG31616.1 DDE family transposase [Geobacillus sp. C56-T2]
MKTSLSLQEEWHCFLEGLRSVLSCEELEQMARDHRFIQRKGKLRAHDFVALCTFLQEEGGQKSLVQLCSALALKQNTSLSAEGLNQRFNEKAVSFLKAVFEKLLIHQTQEARHVCQRHSLFRRIRILDSTSFQLPPEIQGIYEGCAGPGVKIQLEYECLEGKFLHVDVGDARHHDAAYGASLRSTIQEGDLCLKDLGYFSLEGLQAIHDAGAFYISRLKHNVGIYQKEGDQFRKWEPEDFLAMLQPGETIELEDVYVSGKKVHQPRLIVYRLTEKQEQQKEEQWKQKAKQKGAAYVTRRPHPIYVYITNIPAIYTSLHDIHTLYSLRWQIEVIFKTWKSLFHIHRFKRMKGTRFQCHLYGTLIALLISSTVMFAMREWLYRKQKKELSEYKAMSMIKEWGMDLFQALWCSEALAAQLLSKLCNIIAQHGKKSRRYTKKSALDIIESLVIMPLS